MNPLGQQVGGSLAPQASQTSYPYKTRPKNTLHGRYAIGPGARGQANISADGIFSASTPGADTAEPEGRRQAALTRPH